MIMEPQKKELTMFRQFFIANLSVIVVSALGYVAIDLIGYRSVALLLLATISILSIFVTLYPVLTAAVMSALIWDFFFIPPHFTFHVGSSEDVLFLLMYFVVALINGFLTSRIRDLKALELQKEERHNTIKLYKTLFDSISHELRTPIATIVGATDNLLQTESKVSEDDKSKLITEISIAAFRLNRLIDNLLSMQRLESGMLKIKPDLFDINELINSPLNRLKNELSTHHVELNIASDIPILKFDFGLIEQSLFNLLHNETLYTPEDSTIRISADYKQGILSIEIADNGSGFSNEELSLLFSKFYRSNSKFKGGTGLGLSIVKGFVEAHEGTVSVENNFPHGAKFTIKIPSESLEMNDYLDFTNTIISHNSDHKTLSEEYISQSGQNKTSLSKNANETIAEY